MGIFQIRSITGREEFIVADNLDEIIKKSVEKLGLSSMEYKLTWQGTEIKEYEVLQEWIKQFGNPPSMLILPREEEPSHFATDLLPSNPASDALSSLYPSQQPEMMQHPDNTSESREINILPETSNNSEVIISNEPTLRNVTHNGGSTTSINPGMASTSVQSLANNRSSSHPAPFPWCQVPSKIIEVCEKKIPLMPCLLNRIAHIAVDHMDNTPNANMMRMAGQIAEQLCKKYPDSFCDVITNNQGKNIMGTGYESLKNKIYNTYGNRKRLARRESSTDISVSASNSKKRKRKTSEDLDEFGCAEWEPHLPPEETLESQSELKKFLKESHYQNNPDDAKIREALNTSYPTQRVDINHRTESIPKILIEWPSLTQPRYFLMHSSKLLGYSNVDSVFRESIEYQSIIHSYMNTHQLQKADKSTKSLESIRDILCEAAKAMNDLGQNLIHISIIPLLVAYFDENPDHLFRIVDSNTTKEDLRALVTTPTPVLIVMGQSLYDVNATYVVYIDQDECIYPTNTFQGFLIVFLAYYVFGLEYAEEVKTTLEFIQRVFLNINPTTGYKRVRGGKRRTISFDTRVRKLSVALEKFRNSLKRTQYEKEK